MYLLLIEGSEEGTRFYLMGNSWGNRVSGEMMSRYLIIQ